MDEILSALQRWYTDHCDGEREHQHGIRIESCDNPGWWVRIDLEGSELMERSFPRVAVNVDAENFQNSDRWLSCYVKDGVWNGAGDETKLTEILRTFLVWAEGPA
jgi:hypothetical protein